MKLLALLSNMPDADVAALHGSVQGSSHQGLAGAMRCALEDALPRLSYLRGVVLYQLPPAFAMVDVLLSSNEGTLSAAELENRAMLRAKELEAVSLSLLESRRGDDAHLYVRVLLESWRSELSIDASESAILSVLRQELRLRDIDHSILQHHPSFQPLWQRPPAFADQLRTLVRAGVLYLQEGQVVLPSEMTDVMRRALGVEITPAASGRLMNQLSGAELQDGLDTWGLRTSGSKDERIGRLLEHMIQPSDFLGSISLDSLRAICSHFGWPAAGNKEDLLRRIVAAFGSDRDIAAPVEEPAPPPAEPRALTHDQFQALFGLCTGIELREILSAKEASRVSGSKADQLEALSGCPYSEHTLLEELTLRSLQGLCDRADVHVRGSKSEHISALVEHFARAASSVRPAPEPPVVT